MNCSLTTMRWALGPLLILITLTAPGFSDEPEQVDLSQYFGFGPLEIYKLEKRSQNLRAADLDNDGLTDLVLIDNSHSRIDWLRQRARKEEAGGDEAALDVNAVPNSWRFEHLKIPVDREVLSMVTGDFNKDGRVDLAYIGKPDRLVVRFRDESDPTNWTERKMRRLPDLVEGTTILAAGDLNGDGRDDLAVLGKQQTYLIYQNDKGTLMPAERMMNTSTGLRLLQAADLDGDGRLDLCYTATEEGEATLCARLQTPGGGFGFGFGFGPEMRFPLSAPRSITLAQIDGKPGRELLTIDATTGRLAISKLRRPEESTEELPGRLVQYGFGQAGTRDHRDLAIGDVDGDGRLDVVVTDPEEAQMMVFRQHENIGLDLGTTFPGLLGAEHLRLADLDGDDQAEVYVLSEEEGMVGVSRFEDGRLNFPRPLPVGPDPLAFTLAQVDGKGGREMVVIFDTEESDSYTLKAFSIEGQGGKEDENGNKTENKNKNKEVHPVELGQVGTEIKFTLDGEPARILAFEGNGDGRGDFVIFLDRGRPSHVFLSDAKKGLVEMPESSGIGLGDAEAGDVAIGTLLDPEKDQQHQTLLVAQESFARSLDLSEGQWRVVDQYNAPENGAKIVGAATLDLDGKPGNEVVLVDTGVGKLRVLRREENLYTRWQEVEIGPFPYLRSEVADLNDDGREDLLLFGRGRFAVLYAGRSDPRLEEIASFDSELEETFFIDSVAGDINNDGFVDIALFDTRSHFVEILDVDPRLGPRHALHFPIFQAKSFSRQTNGWGTEPREAKVADVTGDGLNDLVVLVHDRVLVYPQDRAGKAGKKAIAEGGRG